MARESAKPKTKRLSIADQFSEVARQNPKAIALRFLDPDSDKVAELDFSALERGARAWAEHFQTLCNPGERVMILVPGGIAYVQIFLACAYANLVSVPLRIPPGIARGKAKAQLAALFDDCTPSLVIAEADLAQILKSQDVTVNTSVLSVEELPKEPTGAPLNSDLNVEELVYLQYTSGSTGVPKGVSNTHASILHQVEFFQAVWPGPEPIHMVTWLPLYHDMGMILGLLSPLLCGGTCTLMQSQAFLTNPRRWLQAISDYRGNWIVCPDFGYRHLCDTLDQTGLPDIDLSSLRYIGSAAEPIRHTTLERLVEKLEPVGLDANAVNGGYGLAEACLCVSMPKRPHHWRSYSYDAELLSQGIVRRVPKGQGRELVLSGNYFHRWQVVIVDPDTHRQVPMGHVGEIWVGGEGLPSGYWNKPEETARTFQAQLIDGRGPFMRTGDFGFIDDGGLIICGRVKDLIILGGANHHPNDLEATIEKRVEHVLQGGACAVQRSLQEVPGASTDLFNGCENQELLLVFIEIERKHNEAQRTLLIQKVRAALAEEHRLAVDQVVLIRRGQLSRTSSGKIRRSTTADRYLRGELVPLMVDDAIARDQSDKQNSLSSQALGRILHDTLRDRLGLVSVNPNEPFSNLGLDSVSATAWLETISQELGLKVPTTAIYEFPTLQELEGAIYTWTKDSEKLSSLEKNTSDMAPLTPVQHAYLAGRKADQAMGGVSCHVYCELDGFGIDPEQLSQSISGIVERHAMLRSAFQEDGFQRVLDFSAWSELPHSKLTIHDLRQETDPEAQLLAIRENLSHQLLAVEKGEVFNVHLSLLPCGRTRLHMQADMLAVDAGSLRILQSDLAAYYLGLGDRLPALEYSFEHYLNDAKSLGEPTRERAKEHWQQRIPSLPGAPSLPLACDPSTLHKPQFVRREHRISAEAWSRLKERSEQLRLPPTLVLATAFSEILAVWGNDSDFLLNLTILDRKPLHPSVNEVIGDFTRLLPLAVDMENQTTFAEQARKLSNRFHEDMQHIAYDGVEVLRDLSRARGASTLWAPVVFTSLLGNSPFDNAFLRCFGEPQFVISQTPQVWLDHQLYEEHGGLVLTWDAVDELFLPGVLDAMFEAYGKLLDWLGQADWDRDSLPSLLPQNQLAVRTEVNATSCPYKEGLIHEAFFKRGEETPDRVALCSDQENLTYGEVSSLARRIASSLHHLGIQAGQTVAITLPKGSEQIISVLGVLAAGCTYVPTGVEQPVERRARMLANASVAAVITDRETPRVEGVKSFTPAELLDHSSTPLELQESLATDPSASAYVIFTSGSTGTPKGVEVAHSSALNTIQDICQRFEINEEDRVLAISALDFDLSVWDIFGVLGEGGALVLIKEKERRDPARWLQLCLEHGVTVWNSVPALLDMLLTEALAEDPFPNLRVAMLSGDWIGLDLPERLHKRLHECRLIAMGGATEASIWSNYFEVNEVDPNWRSIPYGYPLANQQFRVVDNNNGDCPDWVAGELWIGGLGVAKGYRGDEENTQQSFLTEGETHWYRTGDQGRYWPNGMLEFLGRNDSQVKIRGHRVELGEVEAALLAQPEIRQAAAVTVGPRQNQSLIGFYVTDEGATSSEHSNNQESGSLLDRLNKLLPSYAVPSNLVCLSQLPLSANGKVDRKQLSQLAADIKPAANEGEPPRGELEERVAQVFCEVLGLSIISRDSDFFLSGGDSLLASRIVAGLRGAGINGASVGSLFAKPRLADFANSLALTKSVTEENPNFIELKSNPSQRYEPFPLTEVQRAYWLGRDSDFVLGGVGTHYFLELENHDLDLKRLEQSFNQLIQRHDMLRAVIAKDGEQQVLKQVPWVSIAHHFVEKDEIEAAALTMRNELSHRVYDLAQWPPFELRYVGNNKHGRLGVSIDYTMLDGLSMMILLADLDALYRGESLPQLGLTFRDYVEGIEVDSLALEQAHNYWLERLPNLPAAPSLPLACAPESISRPHFTRRERIIEADRWQQLESRARQAGLTPSSLLMTCYAQVLSRWSASPALTLNVTLFDRQLELHPDLSHVLGDFTSLLLVDYQPVEEGGWLEDALTMQCHLGQALSFREASAVWLTRELAKQRGTDAAMMPVVFTSSIGLTSAASSKAAEEGIGELSWGLSQTPQVWLDHQVYDANGGVRLCWDAVEELFSPGMLDDMFEAYGQLLDWLADNDWSQEIPDLLPANQKATRDQINATAAPLNQGLLHGGFFSQAESEGDRLALISAEATISYAELSQRARTVAAGLQNLGLCAGDRVAVSLPKGIDQIVAVLGTLAAGGVYIPMGVDQPAARRSEMCKVAEVAVVITESAAAFSNNTNLTVKSLSDIEEAAQGQALLPQQVTESSQPESSAYVIFTSGSTGTPKGVEIAHQAALNTIDDIVCRFNINSNDRTLAISALDFDLSVWDIFGLLSTGGALVLPAEGERRDPQRWLQLCNEFGVTLWNSVPALLDMALTIAEGGEAFPNTLRLAMLSGDWLGLDLLGRLRQQTPECQLIALGGATEASIWSNYFAVDHIDSHWRSVPYGYPLRNQCFRVVDAKGRDCPDWVPGELWIGGEGVAKGYLGAPELTNKAFLEVDGTRFYRTGDQGRYWPGATLEFLGRNDHQVKVRGHRIELGEIETALVSHQGIRQAVVVVIDQPVRHLAAALVEAHGSTSAQAISENGQHQLTLEIDNHATLLELEAELAEVLLLRTLRHIQNTVESDAVFKLWTNWLVERDIWQLGNTGKVEPGKRLEQVSLREATMDSKGDAWRELEDRTSPSPFAPIYTRATQIAEQIAAVLSGDSSPLLLLDDADLSPEAMSDVRPETQFCIQEVAREIQDLSLELQRPVKVCELGARTGRATRRLLETLDPSVIDYTLLDAGSVLCEAEQRLADLPHTLNFHAFNNVVSEDLHHSFDVVFAPASLHRYADLDSALHITQALLHPSGKLLALEVSELPPLALLTVAVIERGFVGLEDERKENGTPLLDATSWEKHLTSHGFKGIQIQIAGGALLLSANASDTATLDLDELKGILANQLPHYMVPEHFGVLGQLPLSSNGKVDRKAITRLLGASVGTYANESDEPLDKIEQLTAEIWREALGATQVSRNSDFFMTGGDSLTAARVVARLRTRGVAGATVATLFAHPVLTDFTKYLELGESDSDAVIEHNEAQRFEPFPLTDVQRAYWVGRSSELMLGGVGAHCYFEFDAEDFDLPRFEAAWHALIERHDMLRVVVDDDGNQCVLSSVPKLSIPCYEEESRNQAEQSAIERMRSEMSHQVIDLATWPPFDVRAARTNTAVHIGVSLDNLVLDGLSMLTLFAELDALYRGAVLEPVAVSFRDYICSTQAHAEGSETSRQFWRDQLATLPMAPELPLAKDPEAIKKPRFKRREYLLDKDCWQALTENARHAGITPSALLMTAYCQILSAWSGRSQLTLNVTLFDRNEELHPEIHRVLGDFTSLLLLPYHAQPSGSFQDDARALQSQLANTLQHRDVSAVWVMRELARQRGNAIMMPVVFTSALGLDPATALSEEGGGFGKLVWGISQTPQVWLDHQVHERADGLRLSWDAVEELFAPGALDAMFAAYCSLLEQLASRSWSESIPDLLPESQRQMRAYINATEAPVPEGLLQSGFFRVVQSTPEHTALISGDEKLSYGTVSQRALSAAAGLKASGIQPGDAVAITLPKGPDQIIAVLAVLATGALYVPMGVDQPIARRRDMIERGNVKLVINNDEQNKNEPCNNEPSNDEYENASGVLEYSLAELESLSSGASLSIEQAISSVSADASAYVIFTSGSTGQPKGVEVSHRSALNTVKDIDTRFDVNADDRVLAVSALDFDLSVWDIFGVLGVGGTLVIPAEDERRDAQRWLELCVQHRVTVWNSVPALLDMALTMADAGEKFPRSLRLALVSGDWVPLNLHERLMERAPGCRLIAMGGATEAAIWSNYFEVTNVEPEWHSIPYGRPLLNQQFRVMDELGRDCPDWVTGELWIGGEGVAVGYRGDPERSAERFITKDDTRWYRTGDQGRYWPDGTLEFLGRNDQQVKIRGHRIELGEIEAAILDHPEIEKAAVVVVKGERSSRLHGFFVADENADVDEVSLEVFLGQKLPSHCVPAAFSKLPHMPLSDNGKVDRKALTEQANTYAATTGSNEEPVRGGLETSLAAIWTRLLPVSEVYRNQSFFLLGGDSILATRMVEAMRRELGVQISLRQVFAAPTLAELARVVASASGFAAMDDIEDDVNCEEGVI